MAHVQIDSSLFLSPATAINMHYCNGPCSNRLFTICFTCHCHQYAFITMAHVQIDSSLFFPPATAINMHYYNGPCSNRLFTICFTCHCHQYAFITMAHVQIDSSLSFPPAIVMHMMLKCNRFLKLYFQHQYDISMVFITCTRLNSWLRRFLSYGSKQNILWKVEGMELLDSLRLVFHKNAH